MVLCQNLCVPAHIGIKEPKAWQRASCWNYTWQSRRNPRDWVAQITLNLRKAARLLKPVEQKWHEHTSKYSWSFSKKHNQEGMSGQEGARKAAFDGAMRTETRGNQSKAKIRRSLRSQTFPGATEEKRCQRLSWGRNKSLIRHMETYGE